MEKLRANRMKLRANREKLRANKMNLRADRRKLTFVVIAGYDVTFPIV